MFKKSILLLVFLASITIAFNVTTYTYKTIGDLKIELDVYIPPVAPPTTGYPVFFAVHGGGYLMGSKATAFIAEELTEALNRGWVVVSVDYRLLSGALLQEMLEDVQDAYQWVRTELVKINPINIDLITVFGQSAGGGLAVLSGYKLSPRPKVVIGFYSGCTNWTDPAFYNPATPVNPLFGIAANKFAKPVVTEYIPTSQSDPKMIFWNAVFSSGKLGWLVTTHDPEFSTEEIIKSLRSFSAVENVDENYPPTYLAHGLVDVVVPYSQSVQLASKFEEFNIPYVLDLVPNANHNFDFDLALWQQHVLPAFDFAQKYMQTNSIEFLEK